MNSVAREVIVKFLLACDRQHNAVMTEVGNRNGYGNDAGEESPQN